MANAEYVDASKHTYTSLDAFHVVIFVFLLYFLSSLFTYLLIAAGEQGKLLKINAYLTVVNAVGNIALIPYFSFFGSACMTLVCQILLLFWTERDSRHLGAFRFDAKFSIYTVFAAAVSGVAVAFGVSVLHLGAFTALFFGALAFTLLYGAFLLGFFREDAEILYAKLRKKR